MPSQAKPEVRDYSRLSLDELDRLLADRLKEQKDGERKHKFLSFVPLPFQLPWFHSQAKHTVILAGNRVGKTQALIIRALMHATGTNPIALGGADPAGKWDQIDRHGHRLLIAGDSFQSAIPNRIIPKLQEYVDPAMLKGKPKHNQQGIPCLYRFKSGAELHIMSYEQGRDAHEGAAWHWIGLDEPPPEDVYNAIRRGSMDFQAPIVIAATPMSEPWMNDRFVLAASDPDSPEFGMIDVFSCSIWENAKSNGGYIPDREIESMLAGLSTRERAARERGVFMDLQGVEFDYVSRETHVVPDFEKIPPTWPIIEVVDPSTRRGFFAVWMVVHPDDCRTVVWAEHVNLESLDLRKRRIHEIRRVIVGHEPRLCIMDARGGGAVANITNDDDFFRLLRREPFPLNYQPSKETDLGTLHDWLRRYWNPEKQEWQARLKFTETVAHLPKGPLWALERFQWNLDTKTRTALYRQEAKDLIDCLRYGVGFTGASYKSLTLGLGDEQRRPVLAESYATTQQRSQERSLWYGPGAAHPARYATRRGSGRFTREGWF